jgi:redox-sensitive bicupin YhaK (pirin superfamily)
MNITFYQASERGYADHGWLKTWHSFSFASYYDPKRMGFGMIRVLNDDTIAPSMGFGMHPHDNMEIISYAIKGSLKHVDSMGYETIINKGEVQHMSAGSGIMHSEFNASETEVAEFLQIWIIPELRNITPIYHQIQTKTLIQRDGLRLLASPDGRDGSIIIAQDVLLYEFYDSKTAKLSFLLKGKGRGVFIFVIEGTLEIGNQRVYKRDAIGIMDIESVDINILSESRFLIFDTPK